MGSDRATVGLVTAIIGLISALIALVGTMIGVVSALNDGAEAVSLEGSIFEQSCPDPPAASFSSLEGTWCYSEGFVEFGSPTSDGEAQVYPFIDLPTTGGAEKGRGTARVTGTTLIAQGNDTSGEYEGEWEITGNRIGGTVTYFSGFGAGREVSVGLVRYEPDGNNTLTIIAFTIAAVAGLVALAAASLYARSRWFS